MRMRYAALAATAMLVAALAATILLTSNAGPQPTSAVPQTSEDSPRDAPATLATPQPPDRCTTPTDYPPASAPSTKAPPTTTPRSRTSPTRCSSSPTKTAATRSSAASRSPS